MQGEMKFSFTNQELLDLAQRGDAWASLESRVLKVTANVTDTGNGQKMGAVSTLQFYRLPAKVEFLPITANVYKPMMKYTAYVRNIEFFSSMLLVRIYILLKQNKH